MKSAWHSTLSLDLLEPRHWTFLRPEEVQNFPEMGWREATYEEERFDKPWTWADEFSHRSSNPSFCFRWLWSVSILRHFFSLTLWKIQNMQQRRQSALSDLDILGVPESLKSLRGGPAASSVPQLGMDFQPRLSFLSCPSLKDSCMIALRLHFSSFSFGQDLIWQHYQLNIHWSN